MTKKRTKYISYKQIITINKVAIKLFEVKKADKHEIYNHKAIREIISNYKKEKGDHYDKATILLKQIVQKHPFASGNRRTAMLCTILFLLINKQKVYIKNSPYNSKTLLGIRENYYSDEEIKNWLTNGKIKTFKRFE